MQIGRFAPWYRWVEYAAFGRALETARFAFLARLAQARRILILGEGDGRVLARLLHIAPNAAIHVVEISPEMIALARQRTRDSARVRFLCENALTVALPQTTYDAVVALFIFDCFSEADLRRLIAKVQAASTSHALWAVSDFSIPDCGWRRAHAVLWLGTMYRFFGLVSGLKVRTLPPIGQLLTEAGLTLRDRHPQRFGLLHADLWALAPETPPSASSPASRAIAGHGQPPDSA